MRGAQEREAAQKAIDEQPVLMADIYGNGHIGPRAQTEAKVRGIQKEYYDAVGANIAGGFFGALGYLIAGDQGSFAGAGVDNAAQAVVALGEAPRMAPAKAPRVRLEPEVRSAPVPKSSPKPQTAPIEGTVYRTSSLVRASAPSNSSPSIEPNISEFNKLLELQKKFDALVETHLLPEYLEMDPNLSFGYTGSFSTGVVGNTKKSTFGQPINLNSYDIDFWIKSDILFEKFGSNLMANPKFRAILGNTPGFEGLRANKKGFTIKFKPSTKR